TDLGNYVRLLVSSAFRKAPQGPGKPVPVVDLERFDTFDASNLATKLAHGKDLLLFRGFQIDLDTGQIVPEGQGGDLQFVDEGEGGPRLVAQGLARIFTVDKPLNAATGSASRP